jgi:MFS family permease
MNVWPLRKIIQHSSFIIQQSGRGYLCCMNSTIDTSPKSNSPSSSGNLFVLNLRAFFGHSQARAVGLVFASDSLLFGSWVAHIPSVKARLNLSDGELGLALFAMPLGLLVMNPLTGRIINRLGEARTCFWAAIGLCISICIPINAPTIWVMMVGLFMLGICGALINVAMNAAATNVEKAHGLTIMSSCHGMWSVGGMVGSSLAGVVIAAHIAPALHIMASAGFILLLTFVLQPTLRQIPDQADAGSTSFVRPNLDLLIMIFIGLVLAMGEGTAFDWSAVYLRDVTGASPEIAALGFGAFSLTMTLGRFTGDAIIQRVERKLLLQIGSLVAAGGLVLMMLLPYPPTALLGFLLLGAGCSLGAPILYAAALRIPGIPPAAGLSTFATFSFIGFLAGPPVIGFVADALGLPWGIALVAVLSVVSAVLSRRVQLH